MLRDRVGDHKRPVLVQAGFGDNVSIPYWKQKCRNYAIQKSSCITLIKTVVTTLLKSVVGVSVYAALLNGFTFEKGSTNYAFQKYSYDTFVLQCAVDLSCSVQVRPGFVLSLGRPCTCSHSRLDWEADKR